MKRSYNRIENEQAVFPFTGSVSHHIQPQSRGQSSTHWMTCRRSRQVGIGGPHCFLCDLWGPGSLKSNCRDGLLSFLLMLSFSLCGGTCQKRKQPPTGSDHTRHRQRTDGLTSFLPYLERRTFSVLPSHFCSSDPFLRAAWFLHLWLHLQIMLIFGNPKKYFRQ